MLKVRIFLELRIVYSVSSFGGVSNLQIIAFLREGTALEHVLQRAGHSHCIAPVLAKFLKRLALRNNLPVVKSCVFFEVVFL